MSDDLRTPSGVIRRPSRRSSMYRSLAIAAGILLAALAGGAALPAQTDWVAPATEKARNSPLSVDKQHVEQGEKLAKLNCSPCHGALGKGDGAAAIALTPKPADWTSTRVQSETDG